MIVVTGATGNVGRPLVEALTGSGQSVTAVSRGVTSPQPARPGVTPLVADLSDAASMDAALEGSEALFLLVSGAGAHVDGPAILQRAQRAGVVRVVLVSSQAVGTRPDAAAYAPLADLERAVQSSGLEWTVLRPSGFMTNTFAWAPSIRAQRTVYAPYADVALPAVDPQDIAHVAAAALAGGAHVGRTYVLTGPEPTSARERADVLGDALGADLTVVDLDHDQALAELLKVMPEPVARSTLDLLGWPTVEERQVTGHVDDVLGRPATSFEVWARRHLAVFR